VARPEAAIRRAVRLGRGPRRQPRPRLPVFRPFMLAHPLEERGSLDDYAAEWKWDGIRVQLSMPAARPGSTAAPATTFRAASRTSPSLPDQACSTASCWCAVGPGQRGPPSAARGELQRAPATARAQECQPQDARRLSRLRAALRHPVRRRRGLARAAVDERRARLEAFADSSIPSASTSRN
jgi:DNA ligase-1